MITLETISNGTETGQVTNWAEIAEDDAYETYGTTDTDSTPDSDQGNDNQPANAGDATDDVDGEDGNNGGDEDDHDPAVVQLDFYDLALTKELTSAGPFVPGSDVTFSIELTNQGTVAAEQLTITDYIPTGLTLAAGSDWTMA